MTIHQILAAVSSFDEAFVLAPDKSSGAPEIAWGDYFCYYAPDGRVPANVQPYATIVTKNYPGDTGSALGDGRWRVNIHLGRAMFERLIGHSVRDFPTGDPAVADVVLPHPVYGSLGWIAVVNPAERTTATVLELLRTAHDNAKARATRRSGGPDPSALGA